MNDSKFRISLDIHRQTTQAHLAVKRGDTGRQIIATLSDGGVPYIIGEDCYAVFMAKKPDGNVLYNDCAIENNRIIYSFTEQTACAAGRMLCELRLYGSDDTLITSPRIAIIVSGTVYKDSEVESSSEFTTLSNLVTEARAAIEEAQQLEDGDSAYEVAVNNGFEGTEEEWLESLRGPEGPRGEQGKADAFYATITQNSDGTYSADKTFAELRAAYNAGKTLYCLDNSMILALVQASDTLFTFQAEITRYMYRCEIGPENTVDRTVLSLALTADLPKPEIVVAEVALSDGVYSLVDSTYAELLAEAEAGKAVRLAFRATGTQVRIYRHTMTVTTSGNPYLLFSYINMNGTETIIVNAKGAITRSQSSLVNYGRKINGYALSADIELTAEDVGALPDTTAALPNPKKLTFTGAVTGSYDGSSAVTVDLPVDTVPDYVQEEAKRVAAVVQGHQNANTVTFLACSDPHYPYPGTHTYSDQIGESLTHMGQAMGLLRKFLHIDFAAYLGDTVYNQGENNEQALEAMRFVSGCLAEGFRGIPNFRMRGNYENLDRADGPTGPQIFANIGIHNRGAVYDPANRQSGYCYRDFEEWKLRVILVNTNETYTGKFAVSDAQCTWLANALDLSALGGGWRSVLLSHHPLDWNNQSSNIMAVIKAASGILCAFHGHVHGFRVDTITGTQITRIAIPNACFYRNNEYGRNSIAENADGTEFGEETTYNKTAGTGEDTAFCVVTIDLAAKKIFADHYGAGYDRVIALDGTELATFTVTNTLSNVTSSNAAATVTEGTSYSVTLTPIDGYYIKSIIVTMGGTDVTATAYSGGKISIASVTGDIVITATAAELSGNYSNLVPSSLASDGTVYNGTGYKDGAYVSSGGTYGSDVNCVSTGLISYKAGDVIYVKGASLSSANHVRLYFQKSNASANGVAYFEGPDVSSGVWTAANDATVTIQELGTNYYMITPSAELTARIVDACVYRMSLYGTGENLIITHNEPIE